MPDDPKPTPAPIPAPSLPPDPPTGSHPQTEQSKALAVLGSLHPSAIMAVMTLVGALGGSSLVVAMGGATSEQVEDVRELVDDNDKRLTRIEYDLDQVRKKADSTENIQKDLSIVKNDLKHMSEKVAEISRILRGAD